MSLAEPKHEEEIEQAHAARKARRLRYTVGLVYPNGMVQSVVCYPPEKGILGQQKGDCPAIWMNGRAQITERWEKKGVRLLEDVCKADGCPEKYTRWREVIALGGKAEIRNVDDLYPPTVHRLRREAETGLVEGQIYDAATGQMIAVTPETMAKRVAELTDAAGIGRPTDDDRKAAKKAAV